MFRIAGTVLLVAVVLATGCTGSDPLRPNTNGFTVNVVVDNPSTRFDLAQFFVEQIDIRSVDPAGSGVTTAPFGLVGPTSERMLIDFNAAPQASLTKSLGNGTYRIEQIQLSSILLRDSDPPASNMTCEEFITNYPTQPSGGGRAELFDLGQDVMFTVDNTQSNQLTIRIDGQAFLAAYQAGWFCLTSASPFCNADWCLDNSTGWLEFVFTLDAPNYLTFQ